MSMFGNNQPVNQGAVDGGAELSAKFHRRDASRLHGVPKQAVAALDLSILNRMVM